MCDIVHPPFYSNSFTMFFFIVTINASWGKKKSHELPEKLPCATLCFAIDKSIIMGQFKSSGLESIKG